jgi:hypothetical protein
MTEEQRKARNESRLAECHPAFGKKVAAILTDLEGLGLRPRIQEAWRSPTRQRQLLRAGFTKLAWGMHNATGPEGKPEALAVDILDDERPNKEGTRFLLMLAASAKVHGCVTGIAWGLSAGGKKRVEAAIAERDFDGAVPIGWDPCHVQVGGISFQEARAGRRPTVS